MAIQNTVLEITKVADTPLSKVGDAINYTITLTNRGQTDLIIDSVIDSILGSLTSQFPTTIPIGQSASAIVSYTVASTDPNPLVNTVTVSYRTNATLSETATVALFQPNVSLVKSGPPISKAGDTVTYTYTITNTSSSNTPNLIFDSMFDDVVGDLSAFVIAANGGILAPGDFVTFTADYLVKSTDPDPLVNTATVHYHPDGFTNDITATDSHTTDIVHPSFTVEKHCVSGTAVPGGKATFEVNIQNTGDIALDIVAVDQGVFYRSDSTQPNQIFTFRVDVPVPSSSGTCVNEVSNTVEVTATITAVDGFKLPNVLKGSATATCPVVYRGRTTGFWQNQGIPILDPNNDGIINNPVTIGSGPRTILVSTIQNSNLILRNNFCQVSGANCGSRSPSLQQNTLERLVAQTLALAYNIRFIPCYSGQRVSNLGCTNLLSPVGLPANATVNDVLALANQYIGNSTSSGTLTQSQASAMINLINCLNQE